MSPIRIAACCGMLLWASVANSNDMYDVDRLSGFLTLSLAEFKGSKQQGSGLDELSGDGRAAIFRGRLQHNAWKLYQGPTVRQAFPTDFKFLHVNTFLKRGQAQFPAWLQQKVESNLLDVANKEIDELVIQFERLSTMDPAFKNKAPAEIVNSLDQAIKSDPFIGDRARQANKDLTRIDKYLDQIDSVADAFQARIRAQFSNTSANYQVSDETKWALFAEVTSQFKTKYPAGGPAVPNALIDPVRGEPDPARFVATLGELQLLPGLYDKYRDKSNDDVEGDEDNKGNEDGNAIVD